MRERPSASIILPTPATLHSLRDALQRRAAIFGPVEVDAAPLAPRGILARMAAALRTVAGLLKPAR